VLREVYDQPFSMCGDYIYVDSGTNKAPPTYKKNFQTEYTNTMVKKYLYRQNVPTQWLRNIYIILLL